MKNFTDSQKRLLIILAIFFIPLFIALTWYYLLPKALKPSAGTNNGTLIQPIYTMEAFQQPLYPKGEFTGKDLERTWTVVHLVNGACDEACSHRLYDTRQIRIALAEDMERVKRVAVVDSLEAAEKNQKMWASHPDLSVLIAAEKGLSQQILSHIDPAPAAHTVFLVDPLGNLMMRFDPELDPRKLMKDVEKLLRLSRIG